MLVRYSAGTWKSEIITHFIGEIYFKTNIINFHLPTRILLLYKFSEVLLKDRSIDFDHNIINNVSVIFHFSKLIRIGIYSSTISVIIYSSKMYYRSMVTFCVEFVLA